MLIFIALLAILCLWVFLLNSNYEFLGIIIACTAWIYWILHIVFWLTSSYDYEKFVVERNSFVESLEYARKNGNEIELASITREVSEWNKQLASSKYDNTVFLLSDYVDNRVQTLDPIR